MTSFAVRSTWPGSRRRQWAGERRDSREHAVLHRGHAPSLMRVPLPHPRGFGRVLAVAHAKRRPGY
jgi:hypothetical protein